MPQSAITSTRELTWRWFGGLYAIGLLPRLALVALRPDVLEPWEYDTLAQNIVGGQGYVLPRFGHLAVAFGDGNLYSFLAATVYLVFGHRLIVLAVIQALIGALIGPLIMAIGRRAFDTRVALFAAVLAALHPGLLVYTLKLHPLGLDVVLMALLVWWLTRPSFSVLGTGLTMGLNLMTRPTFFIAGLVALVGSRWRTGRAVFWPTVLVVGLGLAIAAPWIVRNWVLLGRPVLISSSMEDVWKGNNPIASGSSYLPNGEDIFSASPVELRQRLQAADELQLNDIFSAEVLTFVTHQPGAFIALTVRKLGYFWWVSPQIGLLYPAAWLPLYEAYAAVILVLAAVGVAAIVRGGSPQERLLLNVVASISVTIAVIHALSYVEGRHRWGIEPLLLLLTARGALSAWRASRVLRQRQPGAAIPGTLPEH